MTARRANTTNVKTLAAFLATRSEIDTQLVRLKALSDAHFNVHPDEIHWGHVGDLQHYASLLRQITEFAFKEGEFAK